MQGVMAQREKMERFHHVTNCRVGNREDSGCVIKSNGIYGEGVGLTGAGLDLVGTLVIH